jgi:hypothetical protein
MMVDMMLVWQTVVGKPGAAHLHSASQSEPRILQEISFLEALLTNPRSSCKFEVLYKRIDNRFLR